MEKHTQDSSPRKTVREVRGNPCECVSMEAKWEFFKKEGVVFELKATERLSKMRTGKVFINFMANMVIMNTFIKTFFMKW